jgi:hypothetical protein
MKVYGMTICSMKLGVYRGIGWVGIPLLHYMIVGVGFLYINLNGKA